MIINAIGALFVCAIGMIACKRYVDLGLESKSMVQGVLFVAAGITFGIMAGYCIVHLLMKQ